MGKNPVKRPKIEDGSDEEMEDLKPTEVEKLKKKYDEVNFFFLKTEVIWNFQIKQQPTSTKSDFKHLPKNEQGKSLRKALKKVGKILFLEIFLKYKLKWAK